MGMQNQTVSVVDDDGSALWPSMQLSQPAEHQEENKSILSQRVAAPQRWYVHTNRQAAAGVGDFQERINEHASLTYRRHGISQSRFPLHITDLERIKERSGQYTAIVEQAELEISCIEQ